MQGLPGQVNWPNITSYFTKVIAQVSQEDIDHDTI